MWKGRYQTRVNNQVADGFRGSTTRSPDDQAR